VLWIQGEKDIMRTVEEVEIEKHVLRNVELKIVPEQGHVLIFARESNGFIDEFPHKLGS
jgi:hypothetical protein